MDLAPAGDAVMVEGTPLERVWTRKAGRGLGGAIAFSDTVIYLGAADRHVVAIDLRNGAQRWSSRVAGPVAEGVVADDDRVYTHTERPDGRVYGIDKVRGSRTWDATVGYAASPPSLVHGLLMVSNRKGLVFALNPADGAIRWRRRVGVTRAPAVAGPGPAVIVSTVDSIFRLSALDGRVLERRRNAGAMLDGWVDHPRYRIAGTTDSQVVGYRPDSLTPSWSVRLDAPVIGTPLLQGDTLYALTRIGTLYRVVVSAAPVAELLRRTGTPFLSSPVMVGEYIVAGNADGVLFGFTRDGGTAWQLPIAGPIQQSPLVLPDGFVAIGGRGELHRYRL